MEAEGAVEPQPMFAMAPPAPAPALGMAKSAMRKEDVASEPMAADLPQQKRMVFHEGWISLKSTEPPATLDSATSMAASLGGYVESRDAGSVVLRIPVEVFRANFDRFVALGTLVSKELKTEDITDQFLDTELRLRVAKETLDRLQTLLAESKDQNEKLRLLQEIQRLSQQIELDESRKRELLKKASYSRLTLSVQPFIFDNAGQEEPIGAFQWIHQLMPTRQNESVTGEALEMKIPQGFVDLELDDDELPWAAAASDGAEIWARELKNNPKGDAEFWIEALRIRLGKTFAKAEVSSAGSWKVPQLTSFDAVPYTWLLATRSNHCELQLVEAFFPGPPSKETHLSAVLSVLQEGSK